MGANVSWFLFGCKIRKLFVELQDNRTIFNPFRIFVGVDLKKRHHNEGVPLSGQKSYSIQILLVIFEGFETKPKPKEGFQPHSHPSTQYLLKKI